MNCQISIIIPTLNEAAVLGRTLSRIAPDDQVEVLVADGGSQDSTVQIAEQNGAVVVKSPPGKAEQMNRAATRAKGAILLFLHADTLLPATWKDEISGLMDDERVAAGAFRLRIEGDSWKLRLVEWAANHRSKLLSTPYGDQGLFLRATAFRSLGGFRPIPIMEDFDLVRRLRKQGRINLSAHSVLTSGRRWKVLGVLRTTLTNWLVVCGYYLGVSPTRLASWYRREVVSLPDRPK